MWTLNDSNRKAYEKKIATVKSESCERVRITSSSIVLLLEEISTSNPYKWIFYNNYLNLVCKVEGIILEFSLHNWINIFRSSFFVFASPFSRDVFFNSGKGVLLFQIYLNQRFKKDFKNQSPITMTINETSIVRH